MLGSASIDPSRAWACGLRRMAASAVPVSTRSRRSAHARAGGGHPPSCEPRGRLAASAPAVARRPFLLPRGEALGVVLGRPEGCVHLALELERRCQRRVGASVQGELHHLHGGRRETSELGRQLLDGARQLLGRERSDSRGPTTRPSSRRSSARSCTSSSRASARPGAAAAALRRFRASARGRSPEGRAGRSP